MMESLLKRIERNRKEHTRLIALILCLSIIVSLGVFNGFRKNAVAKTYTKTVLDCPYAADGAEPVAHTHSTDCFDENRNLICKLPELEAHEHSDACWSESTTLVCDLEENPGHVHTEECYTAETALVCNLEESEGHQHSEDCYILERGDLICENTDENHQHTDECYTWNEVLSCGMKAGEGAHVHSDDCYQTEQVLTCGMEAGEGAHTHTDDCYLTEKILTCGKEELPVHVHDENCFREEEITVEDEPEAPVVPEMPVGDPNADLETAEAWERDFDDLELSGNWAADLITVAATQEGNGESGLNFIATLNDAGDAWVTDGYTRYGAWYGTPYAEWSALFVSFCLRYAGIPTENVPNNPTAALMAESFSKGNLFAGADYTPAAGDLIFFDTDEEEGIDNMGIVCSVDTEENTVSTIEGDRTDEVATFDYAMDDEEIVGYGILPQNPDYVPTEENNNNTDETDGLIVKPEETADPEKPAEVTELTADGLTIKALDGTALPEDAAPSIAVVEDKEAVWNQLQDLLLQQAQRSTLKKAPRMLMNAAPAASNTGSISDYAVFDIGLGTEETLDGMVQVTVDGLNIDTLANVPENAIVTRVNYTLYHIHDDAVSTPAVEVTEENGIVTAFTFETDNFSQFVLSYTVDFHYEVDGKVYDFSIPGGGFVSFTNLVEVLGITDDTKKFVADVENVEFSTPSLVDISKVEDNTTVGQIKENRGLTCEYSTELTEEQIAEINAQTVESGDWALISLLPFTSEEELKVTMKTGEVFTVKVTDMQITKKVMTAAGETYVITVTCPEDSGIPKTADLAVSEITEDHPAQDRSYAEYVSDAEAALGAEEGSAGYVRLFDIKIVDENDPEIRYQPAPGTSVDVKIELADTESSDLSVVHFADGSETGDVIENVNADGEAILFAAEGFSVYAVVQLGDPAGPMFKTLAELDNAIEEGKSFKLSLFRESTNQYFTSALNNEGCYTVTTNSQNAAEWTIEKADGENCYIIYSDGNGYMKNTEGNMMGYTQNRAEATVFELSPKNQRFYFKVKDESKWLQYSNGGKGIRLYKDNTNATNSQIAILDATVTGDPNHLDRNSYGIMLWNGGVTGKAMMAEENTQNSGSLLPKVLTVVTNEDDHNDKLYAPSNVADPITDWTFHWNPDTGNYTLSANTSDGEKYLKISNDGLTLVEESDASEIQVIRGSGNYANQLCLKCNGKTLAYSGNVHDGFGIATDATAVGNDWLYLVETHSNNIPPEYGRTYVAEKISVSDASLSVDHINQYGDPKDTLEGKYVIIYTRSWNGSGYDYFAVNGEGKLIPCHENGNVIEWVGSSQDDMLWKFIEYKGADGKVTHYYDLYNEATQKWLAPQLTPESHLADDPVGLIMSGRRYGEYYTPILAWDHSSYAYSSLKVDRTANNNANDESIVSCRRTDPESADFYFALVQELNVDDTLHGVPTIDNDTYGISMKMVNLDNKPGDYGYMNSFFGSSAGGLGLTLQQGLVSTGLAENGYPDVIKKPGNNLGTLFSANGAAKANHLFIESTYRETGYYVYDSTQNFATLNTTTGNFTVYDQLGTHDATSKETLKHGQFFPYNDLQPGVFSEKNRQNLYQIDGKHQLDEDDPRKYEQLYLIEDPDYYFGMELEASFEQTPSGLDAWGHDIIFEFSGDDDFWLYVDGELVIDLGGIHSAVSGSVNFRTGDVMVNGVPTTLYNLFLDHYVNRDGMTEEAARDLLLNGREADPENGIEAASPVFTQKDGKYIFTDYSSHTMRIFYFERGASASNLHMKFNLAAVKKGAVQLSKKVENVASASELLFPYQIYYRFPGEQEFTRLVNSTDAFRKTTDYYSDTCGAEVDTAKYTDNYVFHQGSDTPVDFDPYLKIGNHLYEDVFYLSPDKPAEITFPTKGDDNSRVSIAEYYIVECGIDPQEYKKVTVNETELTGSEVSDQEGILDYKTSAASPAERSSVRYVNGAETPGSLKFTKVIHDPEGNEIPMEDYYPLHGEHKYYETGPTFDFRLYFGSPFDTSANTAAYMYVYRVKDPEGKFCHWNPDEERFERITGEGYPDGTANFSDLSDDRIEGNTTIYGDKTLACFDSSTYGAITQIPPYYTVEVLDLVPGLWYKLIERPTETPDGYRLYRCEKDGTVIEESEWATGIYKDDMTWKGVDGRIQSKKESKVKIGNKEGYGLRINKTWTDAQSITRRDPTYFAVFKEDEQHVLHLVDGSVRQMAYTANPAWQTLVWYYDSLPEGGILGNYWVYEVALTVAKDGEISIAPNGAVSGYDTCTPVGINDTGAEDARPRVALDGLTLKGTSAGAEKEIYYKATYGESTPYPLNNSKVRNFTVTNEPTNRPVIKLKKENWKGDPLAGATFSLVEVESGDRIGGNLVSDDNGLFDPEVIYLDYGRSYTLTETESPNGYIGLPQSLTITMPNEPVQGEEEGNVTVSSVAADISNYYVLTQKNETEPTTLTIKNRPYELKVLKADPSTEAEPIPLANAKFKLYKYKLVNGVSLPIVVDGWSEVQTDTSGCINNLPTEPGDYALEELVPPSGYKPLAENDWIKFSISPTGVIGQPTSKAGATLAGPVEVTDDATGLVAYTITIPNTPLPLYLKKVDASGEELTGAKFSLTRLVASGGTAQTGEPAGDQPVHQTWQIVNGYSEIDMTSISKMEITSLPKGVYCLTETLAPDGYVIFESKTYFKISDDRTVTLTDATGTGDNSNADASISYDAITRVYTITVKNTPGAPLPNAGGSGTQLFTILGSILTLGAGVLLWRRRRLI